MPESFREVLIAFEVLGGKFYLVRYTLKKIFIDWTYRYKIMLNQQNSQPNDE